MYLDQDEIFSMAKKVFSLIWVYESFEDDPLFYTRRMFGGLAVYVHEKMVFVLVENPGDKIYREKVYDFEIWNGLLLPTSREFHDSLQEEFPSLVSHPVLGKWLYLAMANEDFESIALSLAEKIKINDHRFGILPTLKKRAKKTVRKVTKKKIKKTQRRSLQDGIIKKVKRMRE